MNTYLVISSLLNFSAALVVALTTFVTARRNISSFSFGYVALSVGLWSGAYALWRLTESPTTALTLSRLLMLGASFIPVTLLHFAIVLTGGGWRRALIGCYSLAVLLGALCFTPALVASLRSVGGLDYWPRAGVLFPLFLAYFFGCIGIAVVLLLSSKAGLSGSIGHRRLVVFALSIGVVGGSTNFPLWYGIPIPPVGNGLVCAYLGMLGYAVTKYRLPHLQPEFVKSAGFFGISTIIGVVCVLASLVWSAITGHMASATQLTTRFFFGMLLTALMLWAVPLIIELTEKFLEQSLLKARYRIVRQLKPLLRVVGRDQEEAEILKTTAERLRDIFAASDVAIYFQGEMEPTMRLCAAIPGRHCPNELPPDHPLLRTMRSQPVTLSAGRLALASTRWAGAQGASFRDLGFELAVPMSLEGRLEGIILLNRASTTRDDSDAVISVLEAVAAQLALTVTARRWERRVNQSDKLIALGTLAAGLAHELRNPLTSINTFVALSERGVNPAQDPAFQRIVLRDAQRISSIVENVSAFATNIESAMGPVDLDKVLASTVEIAHEESKAAAIKTILDCRVNVPVRGNYGQLQQVFVNLVQNAIQAIGNAPGEIQVVAEPILLASGEPGARVVVRDSGPGVSPDVLPRIFEPFVTTKATGDRLGKRGMGLGLAIVKRIIEAHRGDIRVESAPGKGTKFFVYLPACPES